MQLVGIGCLLVKGEQPNDGIKVEHTIIYFTRIKRVTIAAIGKRYPPVLTLSDVLWQSNILFAAGAALIIRRRPGVNVRLPLYLSKL